MKEIFELQAEKENGVVEIKAKGICSRDLLYAVVASIIRNADKEELKHEN